MHLNQPEIGDKIRSFNETLHVGDVVLTYEGSGKAD